MKDLFLLILGLFLGSCVTYLSYGKIRDELAAAEADLKAKEDQLKAAIQKKL